jgi:hypothetical protein
VNGESHLFLKKLAKFRQKTKLKIEIQKLSDFGGFQSPKVREKRSESHQISILGFQSVANI